MRRRPRAPAVRDSVPFIAVTSYFCLLLCLVARETQRDASTTSPRRRLRTENEQVCAGRRPVAAERPLLWGKGRRCGGVEGMLIHAGFRGGSTTEKHAAPRGFYPIRCISSVWQRDVAYLEGGSGGAQQLGGCRLLRDATPMIVQESPHSLLPMISPSELLMESSSCSSQSAGAAASRSTCTTSPPASLAENTIITAIASKPDFSFS